MASNSAARMVGVYNAMSKEKEAYIDRLLFFVLAELYPQCNETELTEMLDKAKERLLDL